VRSATGLLRFSLAIAAVLAAGIATLIVASRLVPPDRVRQAVITEIRDATGLDLAIRGDATVTLFPTAMVSFSDITLGDDRGAPALAADRMTAKLALLPLLTGRIEPADLLLTHPLVTVAVEPDGRTNWSGLMATLARTLKPRTVQAAPVMSLSELRMVDGRIIVTEPAREISEELSDVELSFAWPSIARSFGATGRFTWRDELFDASATAGDLLAALSGDRSGLKLRLSGAPFKLAFEGAMSQKPSFKMEGTLAIDGKSLREALRWANRPPVPGSGMGPFALKAHTSFTGGTAIMSGVNLELDGNVAEGVMAVATEPRVTLKGTLAADQLDLTPYVSTFEVLRSNDRDWSRSRIAIDNLSNFDLDLRLSAARVKIVSARLGRTGVAVNLRDGRLTLAIGEAQAYAGLVKGAIIVSRGEAGAEVKTQLQFTDVDLESCLGDLFGIRKLEGKGNLSLSVEAAGESVLALTRTLNGTADLTARQGAIAGFNVEQLLKRLEQRPLSIGGDFRRGRTPFDRLTATGKIAQGMATIDEMRVEGGAIRLALGGSASIPARDLDLRGTAVLVSATSDARPTFELPFVVQGSWDDPIMLPDAQSLISRSNAAAPLLDAVRDRKTRDAVRSAIERLDRDSVITPAARQ